MLQTENRRRFPIIGGLCAMVVGAAIISMMTNLMHDFQERHGRREYNLALVQDYGRVRQALHRLQARDKVEEPA